MGLSNIFDVASSGMNAQTVRLNVVASNLSNAQTAGSSAKDTYKAKSVVFQPIELAGKNGSSMQGVKVSQILEKDNAVKAVYEPNNPLADKNGYVWYPEVNTIDEMTQMMSASRSYQTQIEVINTTKAMLQRTLTIGK